MVKPVLSCFNSIMPLLGHTLDTVGLNYSFQNAPIHCKTLCLTRMAALLHSTRLMASQVGRSSRLWRTSSSSSRLVSWPSPFSVLRLILSGDRFLANLRDTDEKCKLWAHRQNVFIEAGSWQSSRATKQKPQLFGFWCIGRGKRKNTPCFQIHAFKNSFLL